MTNLDGWPWFVVRSPYQNYYWETHNPTLKTLDEVKPVNLHGEPSDDNGLGRMDRYQQQKPQVSFMSVFPVRPLAILL